MWDRGGGSGAGGVQHEGLRALTARESAQACLTRRKRAAFETDPAAPSTQRVILVDTSVWIQHLRQTESGLVAALNCGEVLTHPDVLGELACGNLRNRRKLLDLFSCLPPEPLASDAEALHFIEGCEATAGWLIFP